MLSCPHDTATCCRRSGRPMPYPHACRHLKRLALGLFGFFALGPARRAATRAPRRLCAASTSSASLIRPLLASHEVQFVGSANSSKFLFQDLARGRRGGLECPALCPSQEKTSRRGGHSEGWATRWRRTAGLSRAGFPAPEDPGSPGLPNRHSERQSSLTFLAERRWVGKQEFARSAALVQQSQGGRAGTACRRLAR